MLDKINRIKKKNDFDAIFKKGKSCKDNSLLLKFIPNSYSVKRFGFITSQKVSKKAVVRNKVRRRLNEVVRADFKDIKNGVDYVFIALPGIEKESFLEVKNSVNNLFKKAKCLNF